MFNRKNTKEKKKKFTLPPSLILLFAVLALMVVLTWFVPVSTVTVNEAGDRVVHFNAMLAEDGTLIENVGTQPRGLWDLFMAPIWGFANGADVSISILISGAFLAIINATGAIDAGISSLLNKYTGKKLLAILMFVFALMGTVYGSCEELPAYALVLIPLCIAAGYDVVTGIMLLFGGAAIGNMASVVNPYATGAAVAAIGNPNLSMGTGIMMRIVLFIVMYIVGTAMVLKYAEGVRKDPTKSVVHNVEGIDDLTHGKETKETPVLTKKRRMELIVFGVMILFVVLGYIPWHAVELSNGMTLYDIVNAPTVFLIESVPTLGKFLGAGNVTFLGDWYFNEFSIVFLIGSVIVAMIDGMSLKQFTDNFVQGVCDLASISIIVSVSRGVTQIIGTSSEGMGITFVYWIQSVLSEVPVWGFVIGIMIAYILVGLLPMGTSSVSGITMPVLGAVTMALFTNSSMSVESAQMILVSGFTVAFNFWFVVYPNAPLMGALEICNIPYDKFLKVSVKYSTILTLVGLIVLIVSPYIGLI